MACKISCTDYELLVQSNAHLGADDLAWYALLKLCTLSRSSFRVRRIDLSHIFPLVKFPANLDYVIWSVIQERVYQARVHDIDELRQRLITVWCELEQRIVDDAIDQWRRRLLACVDAEGGHFEHSL